MNKSFSLLLYLRADKIINDGRLPIYLRITIDGKKVELATKRHIMPNLWDSKTQKSIGTDDESKSINEYLKAFEQDIYHHYRELLLIKSEPSSIELKNKMYGIGKKVHYLLQVFEDHNKKFAALVGEKEDDFAPATLTRYKTTKMHVTDLLKTKYQLNDIDIKKVDHEFITDFEFYLRTVRKCNNNSAVKYIKNFKKIIRICIANGWLDKDPFVRYKSKVKEVERIILTEEEVKAIYNKEFPTERLVLVRDIFIFSCYTGLAYSDVAKLKVTDIADGIDGEKWIHIKRKKTDTVSKIPLLPIPLEMIDKYSNHLNTLHTGFVFPVFTNQKTNSYLKEIADVCGIKKELTFHLARHTFATTITLNNNVPIESVSKMLGHKSLRTTQHYAKILDKKVSDDMGLLKLKLSKNSHDNTP